ncbi:uncharacterized protein LOC134236785, partial [Saccostrea cucullata]|uniref:uncharacterized protein LOC134236785 n=1 Tax=Saccostrea cuccullata TaxID=36930 RepID=UPI002ED51E0D
MRTLLSSKSNTDESLDKHEQIHDRLLPDYVGMHLNEKQEPGGNVYQSKNSKMDDQIHAAVEYEDSVSQDIWIPPTTYKISSPQKEELLIKTINFPRDCVTKVSPEEELSILFDELKFILENDAYDESLRKSLQESYPEYLKMIEKRKNDLLKDDHGIVVA